ncbi:hypothetical protein Q8814_25910, partial [Rhodococcus sp. CC-R104]|nr:hypothetical protein [Rhodococcus sp. CC-R104]
MAHMDLGELACWDPDALHDFGFALGHHAAELERVVGDIRSAGRFREEWAGPAHDAAASRIAEFASAIAAQGDSYRAVCACAYRIAPRLRELHAELADVRQWAAERSLGFAADGSISAAPGVSDTDRGVLHGRLDALTDRATALDEEAAAILARAFDEETANGGDGSGPLLFGGERARLPRLPQVPEVGTDPDQVAQWWQRLDDFDRTALLIERPESIGPLDGIPAGARDLANRALLDIERVRLEQVARQPVA